MGGQQQGEGGSPGQGGGTLGHPVAPCGTIGPLGHPRAPGVGLALVSILPGYHGGARNMGCPGSQGAPGAGVSRVPWVPNAGLNWPLDAQGVLMWADGCPRC